MAFTDLPFDAIFGPEPFGSGCVDDAPHLAVRGHVHSSEVGGAVDGPGVRYVLFLAGCALRCLYCHNPDTWHFHQGRETTSGDVVRDLDSYADFLKRAGGGLTISGGEPLVQPAFTAAILRGAKTLGLHTALDTSGFLGRHASEALLADTDLVLLDIKAFTEETYRHLTGVALKPTLDFARRLADAGKPIWLRYVLVPGLTDKMDEIEGLAAFAADLGVVERVDVLPFHKLGEHKWGPLGLTYRLHDVKPPSLDLQHAVHAVFRAKGLSVHAD